MTSTAYRLFFVLSCFFLAACGDGYEAVRTSEPFPYGNQRTAGSVIAYVKIKMMPEKTLKIEPMVVETKVEPAPIVVPEKKEDNVLNSLEKEMDALFKEKQKK